MVAASGREYSDNVYLEDEGIVGTDGDEFDKNDGGGRWRLCDRENWKQLW